MYTRTILDNGLTVVTCPMPGTRSVGVALACGAHSGWSNNIFTVVSDQFPSRAVGSVTGLAGFAGGIGGILFSTVLVGYIITYVGYLPIFLLMGILHPIAMLCIHVLIKRDSPVEI